MKRGPLSSHSPEAHFFPVVIPPVPLLAYRKSCSDLFWHSPPPPFLLSFSKCVLVFPFAFMHTNKAKTQILLLTYLVPSASVLKLFLAFLPGSTYKMARPKNLGFLRKAFHKNTGLILKVTRTWIFKASCRITFSLQIEVKSHISNTLPLNHYLLHFLFRQSLACELFSQRSTASFLLPSSTSTLPKTHPDSQAVWAQQPFLKTSFPLFSLCCPEGRQ